MMINKMIMLNDNFYDRYNNKYFNKKNQNINYSKPINLVILSI